MNAGKLAQHASIVYELELDASSTVDTDCWAMATATLYQVIATSPSTQQSLFQISLQYTRDNSGITRSASVSVESFTANYPNVSRVRLVIENFRLYLIKDPISFYFSARADAIRIYADNVLQATLGPINAVSFYIAPAGVPFLGATRAQLSPQVGVTLTPLAPCLNEGSSQSRTASIEATARAGYTVDGSGYPMRVDVLSPPADPCGNPRPEMPSISAASTDSVQMTCRVHETQSQSISNRRQCAICPDGSEAGVPVEYVVEDRDQFYEGQSAGVTIAPACVYGWLPLADDTRALVDDYARPEARARAITSSIHEHIVCGESVNICTDTNTETALRVPEVPRRLTTVGSELLPSTHATAPYNATAVRNTAQSRQSIICSPGSCSLEDPENFLLPLPCRGDCYPSRFEQRYSQCTSTYPELSTPAGVNSYLNHTDTLLRFWNTVYHPHWSRFLYFDDWSTGYPLTPVSRDIYWRPLRVQYLEHANLPEPLRTRRRAHPLLEPFNETVFTSWIADNYSGYDTWWLGVPRFTAQIPASPPQVTLTAASAPRWSAVNAVASFGASNIAVIPTGTSCALRFELGDFQVPPALYPLLATAVRVQASGATLTGITVKVENAAGDMVTLSSDSLGWHEIGQQTDSVYQGTWCMETRAGEKGQDLQPDGRSLAMQSEPLRRFAMQLFACGTAKVLILEFTLSAPAPFTVEYPAFRWEGSTNPLQSLAVPLTGNTLAVARISNAYQYLPIDPYTEQVREPVESPNVADYLAMRQLLYEAIPVNEPAVQAAAELLYDAVELSRPVSLSDLRADTRAIVRGLWSYDGEPHYLLINALSAIPPLAMLPTRKLDLNTLQPDAMTDWGCYSYHLTPNRRYYVAVMLAPAHLVQVESSGDRTQLSVPAFVLGIHRISSLDMAVENDETLERSYPRYFMVHEGRDLGRVTPFWGFWLAHSVEKTVGGHALAIDSRRGWIHIGRDAGIVSVYQYLYDTFVSRVRSDATALVGLAIDTRQARLYLLWRLSGTSFEVARSADAGRTEEVILMFTADVAAITTISELGHLYLVYHDGTAARYRVSLDGGDTWSASASIELDGNPMTSEPIAVDWDGRACALVMLYKVGTGYGLAVSRDYGRSYMTVL